MKPSTPQSQQRATPVQRLPSVSTENLFGRGNEVVLVHRGEYYRLRCTKNGKLILNK